MDFATFIDLSLIIAYGYCKLNWGFIWGS